MSIRSGNWLNVRSTPRGKIVSIVDDDIAELAAQWSTTSVYNLPADFFEAQIRNNDSYLYGRPLRILPPFPDLVTMREDIERATRAVN